MQQNYHKNQTSLILPETIFSRITVFISIKVPINSFFEKAFRIKTLGFVLYNGSLMIRNRRKNVLFSIFKTIFINKYKLDTFFKVPINYSVLMKKFITQISGFDPCKKNLIGQNYKDLYIIPYFKHQFIPRAPATFLHLSLNRQFSTWKLLRKVFFSLVRDIENLVDRNGQKAQIE